MTMPIRNNFTQTGHWVSFVAGGLTFAVCIGFIQVGLLASSSPHRRAVYGLGALSFTAISITLLLVVSRGRKKLETDLHKALTKERETQRHLINAEKLISIGKLAAGIAHEINNPVGFVTSNTTTLIDYVNRLREVVSMYEHGINEKMIENRKKSLKFDFICKDIDTLLMENLDGLSRITGIVGNLKNFARSHGPRHMEMADINEALKSTLVIAKNEWKYFADIRTDLGNCGKIPCMINELNQVFLNIIMNAVQAIRSQNRDDKGLITIRTYRDGRWIHCTIADDGPGIPDEVRHRIFDPFFTTKDVGEGTGLGLSISYDVVVNRHQGELTVHSEPGKGTTFHILIPRERENTDG